MVAYQQGGQAGFDELVGRYYQEVYAFLARFVGDRALAEDICQEAFLQIHLSADRFDPAQRFRPWLFTVAANKARDRMRRLKRRPAASLDATVGGDEDSASFADLMTSADPGPLNELSDGERREMVREVVEGLSDSFREALVLCYFHHFSYQEIADMLDVPIGTVKSRIHGAVNQFAERWKRIVGQEDE